MRISERTRCRGNKPCCDLGNVAVREAAHPGGRPPAVAKQRPGPSGMDGPDHLIDQRQFPIFASLCEILPPVRRRAGHLATSQHPRGPLPGGRVVPSGSERAQPSGAAAPWRPALPRPAPRAPSWEPHTPRTRTGTRTRLGSRSGTARLERLGAGPAVASWGAGARRPPGGCSPARGPQGPATWSWGELRTPAAAGGEAPRRPVSAGCGVRARLHLLPEAQ